MANMAKKSSVDFENEEKMVEYLGKLLRKQVKSLIEWGDVEDIKDALRYVANIVVRQANESIEAMANV